MQSLLTICFFCLIQYTQTLCCSSANNKNNKNCWLLLYNYEITLNSRTYLFFCFLVCSLAFTKTLVSFQYCFDIAKYGTYRCILSQ